MPGSHDCKRAASQTVQQLPDNTTDALTVLDPAVVRHIWPTGEYERALDLINRGYDKRAVAQIIGRTVGQLNDKLHYVRMQIEDGKRQQRRRAQAQGIELAPASVLEERTARQAAEYRDLTTEFFGDPRPGYSQFRSQGHGMTGRGLHQDDRPCTGVLTNLNSSPVPLPEGQFVHLA